MLGVVFACVMRAWLWSERLAVIEIGLASVIALLAKGSPKYKDLNIKPLTFAPVLGMVALVLLMLRDRRILSLLAILPQRISRVVCRVHSDQVRWVLRDIAQQWGGTLTLN